MPVVVVDIEVVDDGEEEDEEEEVEQGSLQGSWGGIEVEEKLLVELDPVELLTSLYGKTPRIGAVVVESAGKDAVNILIHTQTKAIYLQVWPCVFINLPDGRIHISRITRKTLSSHPDPGQCCCWQLLARGARLKGDRAVAFRSRCCAWCL